MPKLYNSLTHEWLGDRLNGVVRARREHKRPTLETPRDRARVYGEAKARKLQALDHNLVIVPDKVWNG